MILLLPETFVMGEKNGHQSEKPAHRVAIRQPFAVGKYEVTVGEWNACVEEGRCPSKAEKSGNDPNAPVRDISWTEARQYAKWLSRKTGKPYRLPTEAEWEFAARGGTTTRYWWGDELISGKANCKNCGGEWDRKLPARVGSFSPNPFGLHDMNGSVWEWVADCWHGSYAGAPPDGSAWEEKDCRARVIRGGSWRNDSTYAHSASRLNYDADVSYLLHGFRVAKSVE
jgi:formylglycine-generating enzyme required for sulfatase activity